MRDYKKYKGIADILERYYKEEFEKAVKSNQVHTFGVIYDEAIQDMQFVKVFLDRIENGSLFEGMPGKYINKIKEVMG